MENRDRITDSERNLITLVGSAGLTGSPSKYSFAAHMGQLVRGLEGTGCHNFYPDCPFSNQDVLQIARRINFQWGSIPLTGYNYQLLEEIRLQWFVTCYVWGHFKVCHVACYIQCVMYLVTHSVSCSLLLTVCHVACYLQCVMWGVTH